MATTADDQKRCRMWDVAVDHVAEEWQIFWIIIGHVIGKLGLQDDVVCSDLRLERTSSPCFGHWSLQWELLQLSQTAWHCLALESNDFLPNKGLHAMNPGLAGTSWSHSLCMAGAQETLAHIFLLRPQPWAFLFNNHLYMYTRCVLSKASEIRLLRSTVGVRPNRDEWKDMESRFVGWWGPGCPKPHLAVHCRASNPWRATWLGS